MTTRHDDIFVSYHRRSAFRVFFCFAMFASLLVGCGGGDGAGGFGAADLAENMPSGGSPVADIDEFIEPELDNSGGDGSDSDDTNTDDTNTDDTNNDDTNNGGTNDDELVDNDTDNGAGDQNDTVAGSKVTLNWTEPNFYENGEALSRSEIESYEIMWGLNESSLNTLVVIDDPNTLEFIVQGLYQGVYYFSVSVKTIYGNKSDQSNIVRRVII